MIVLDFLYIFLYIQKKLHFLKYRYNVFIERDKEKMFLRIKNS